MTSTAQPRGAAVVDSGASSDGLQVGELTSLVRRWMAVGGRAREPVPRESSLWDATEPDPVAREDIEQETGGADVLPLPPRGAEEPRLPDLPRRTTGQETEHVHRVALLIDARRVSAEEASALIGRLGERGALNVCRAYADWSTNGLGDWAGQMRREGLHSFHHFSDDDDQAFVAMAIDAVDIARDAAVDEVVIAGDLTCALPLVHRLHAAGVRVVAVGPGHTPRDVRAACHEFIDTGSLVGTRVVAQGRHRA